MRALIRIAGIAWIVGTFVGCGIQERTAGAPETQSVQTQATSTIAEVQVFSDTVAPIPDPPLRDLTPAPPEIHGDIVTVRLGKTDITHPITLTNGHTLQIIPPAFAQDFRWVVQYSQPLLEADSSINVEIPPKDGWKWVAKETGTITISVRGSPVCVPGGMCPPGTGEDITVTIIP